MSKAPTYYDMKSSVYLNSTGRSVHMGTRVSPSSEAEAKELEELCVRGTCTKFVAPAKDEKAESKATGGAEAPSDPVVDPEDDLAEVPGVGAKTLEKLNEAGITKASQLKELALSNPAKLEEITTKQQAASFVEHFNEQVEEENTDEDSQPASSREGKTDDEEEEANSQ